MILWKRDLDHLEHLGGGADVSEKWEVSTVAEGTVLWTPAREGQDWVVALSILDFLGSQRVPAEPDMAGETLLCPLL